MNEKDINNNLDSDLFDDDLLSEGEWVTSISNLKKNKTTKLNLRNRFFIRLLIFFTIIFILFYGVKYFFDITLKKTQLTEFEKTYIKFVDENILTYFKSQSWTSKVFDNKSSNTTERIKSIDSYIEDPWIIFYQKQDYKNDLLKSLLSWYNDSLNNIKKNQELLVKYKFLPKELDKLLKDIRIIPILLTLNSIKIYMIDYVYIKTWIFKTEILDYIINRSTILNQFTINRTELEISLIEDIQKLRESWVNSYLKNIKFNYMYSEWNKLINNYFVVKFYEEFREIIDNRAKNLWLKIKDSNGNLTNEGNRFISSYISLIKNVYDRTNELFDKQDINQLPVNVNLLSYDPWTQMLSFNVEIILEERYNINTSVIEIVTDLVSLLRESRLVIWENIKMNNIKVQKVTEFIWWSQVTYNKTNLLFNTSVQSNVNVEVTDIEK